MVDNSRYKFRAWDGKDYMTKPFTLLDIQNGRIQFASSDTAIMQYTGLKDKNGKEIYEGDIKRETIEEDEGDVNLYYVCTWIKEWSMFGWLSNGELINYQDNGAKGLDTEMYWTYPVDEEEANDTVITGNIYENPDLLK